MTDRAAESADAWGDLVAALAAAGRTVAGTAGFAGEAAESGAGADPPPPGDAQDGATAEPGDNGGTGGGDGVPGLTNGADPPPPGDPNGTTTAGAADVDVVEGFRYVLNVLGDQLDRETLRDSSQPLLLPGITPVRKLFFDNPDTDYDTALVVGDRTYRITGTRGTVTYLAFCVYSGAATDATTVANLSDADMEFEPDGSFELTLSPTEPANAPNRIRLDPDAHTVIARQYFLDRKTERPARYRIDALGDRRPDPALDGPRFARLARRTARFVTGATELARRRAELASARPNRFVQVPGHGVYGTPDAGYVACWYELGPDEALVVEARPPRCRYWSVHLANLWGQSLDHRTRTTSLNARTAEAGSDGSVRVVVAPTDPGETNWLDTAGHPQGWVLFRWLLADAADPTDDAGQALVPEARVVTLQRDRDRDVRPA